MLAIMDTGVLAKFGASAGGACGIGQAQFIAFSICHKHSIHLSWMKLKGSLFGWSGRTPKLAGSLCSRSRFCLPGLALSGKPNHSFGSVVYGFSGSSWNVMILSMFFGHLAASSASGQDFFFRTRLFDRAVKSGAFPVSHSQLPLTKCRATWVCRGGYKSKAKGAPLKVEYGGVMLGVGCQGDQGGVAGGCSGVACCRLCCSGLLGLVG